MSSRITFEEAHSRKPDRRWFQIGRRSDFRAGRDRSATEMKPGTPTIGSMDPKDSLLSGRSRTRGEIHDSELTTAPCQLSVSNPVENPVMRAFEAHGIESTGFC
jgi:hypothetical protein